MLIISYILINPDWQFKKLNNEERNGKRLKKLKVEHD